ncbi:MAG: type IV pilus assembly protein PilM, partial [Fimbriimonadaceae bacterium]|nr:type IV pilus assembly protein PilM [Fimbriimonadaceae bacterium]
VVPTPKDSVRDGLVADKDALAGAIRMALREGRMTATSAVIAVAGGSVIVRTVRIPKMPEATLRKSIKFEAGRYVPSSIEDSFIEFEIIGEAENGQMDVLIVASPREIVESRIAAVERAGLEVEIVDLEPFAMYRALVEANFDRSMMSETIALVDFGAGTTNVSVVSEGVFAMTRTIPQAGANLSDALKTYFKLSQEDADRGKAQLDLSPLLEEGQVMENPPLRVIQPRLDELIREIRRSLNYYQSQQTEQGAPKPVTRLILSGGSAELQGLAPYFEHKLGVPCTASGVYDNPRFLQASDSTEGPGLDLAVASGLALRAFAKGA